MSELIILLIGFGVGYWVGYRGRGFKKSVGAGPVEAMREENFDKLMEVFKTGQLVTNDVVEMLLGVSDATATRYLDRLEKEGKIVQIGREGRFVKYRLK